VKHAALISWPAATGKYAWDVKGLRSKAQMKGGGCEAHCTNWPLGCHWEALAPAGHHPGLGPAADGALTAESRPRCRAGVVTGLGLLDRCTRCCGSAGLGSGLWRNEGLASTQTMFGAVGPAAAAAADSRFRGCP
jgi:hypothetical protein